MRYMLLIYEAEDRHRAHDREVSDAFNEFTRECIDRGVFLAADPLQDVSTATTVRVDRSERLITDGPFAETREQLAGYYMLDCRDLDEALEFARKLPMSVGGSVEVRPILEVAGLHADVRQGGEVAQR
jgi:hypothetical protein